MTSQLGRIGLLRGCSSAKSFSSEVKHELKSSKSQLFEFATLKSAINNFGKAIGKGGLGKVYEGRLAPGQLIAVKWIKIGSGRCGMQELINVVVLASRLEHKNILKLIGYSITNDAVLTASDYLPKGTLDEYIFDSTKKEQLDWETRYNIIEGIAHGLLYLHEGLEIRIIHRNLKPGCILLDRDMNLKISGFAIAKTLKADQPKCSCEIAGTIGYMAPEDYMLGQCSTKSDIFSFGIIILEMITGQRNYQRGFNLYSYVWKHWKEGTTSQVIDPCFVDQCPKEEVLRCIHIGLICAQDKPEERPTIASVILMLISNSIKIRDPKAPPDYYNRDIDAEDSEVQEDSYREEGR